MSTLISDVNSWVHTQVRGLAIVGRLIDRPIFAMEMYEFRSFKAKRP